MPRLHNMDTLSKILAQAENAGTEAEAETFMNRATEMAQALGVSLDMAHAALCRWNVCQDVCCIGRKRISRRRLVVPTWLQYLHVGLGPLLQGRW